jgi:hypothetical protein
VKIVCNASGKINGCIVVRRLGWSAKALFQVSISDALMGRILDSMPVKFCRGTSFLAVVEVCCLYLLQRPVAGAE